MDTAKLKKFAQAARTDLLKQVAAKLALVLTPDSAARREQPRAAAGDPRAGTTDRRRQQREDEIRNCIS